MIYHILNGDALASSFADTKLEGEVIVFREALVDGDVTGNSLQEFWQTRADYLQVERNEYYTSVVNEIGKILKAPGNSEFNLWFEYDLFKRVPWRKAAVAQVPFAVYKASPPVMSGATGVARTFPLIESR